MDVMHITGGSGIIGTNYIYHELSRYPGMRIVCVDKLTYAGNISNLKAALENPDFSFIRGDIADANAVESIFKSVRPDIVVNFAAESHVDRSIEDPGLFLRTNIIGTQVLMDACRRYDVRRFHQVSTDEVYGDLPLSMPELRFTEKTPLRASSPYSASKASADLLVGAYVHTYGLNATISRCSNNYGPYQFPEKLIPLLIQNASVDKLLPIYGTGCNVRDWIYVTDHCEAVDLIIQDGRPGQVYNIGSDCELKNIDIARRICTALNKPQSLITFVADRPGHDLRYAMDSSLIRTQLCWKPLTGFESGLCRTIEWYRDNPRWLERLSSDEYKSGEGGV